MEFQGVNGVHCCLQIDESDANVFDGIANDSVSGMRVLSAGCRVISGHDFYLLSQLRASLVACFC